MFERVDGLKNQLDQYRPFEEPLLCQIQNYYRIGLTFSSNALEGNSLTESETKVLLEDGLTVGGKPIRDYYEATGHSKAYDFMLSILGGKTISREHIKTLHRLFYQLIDPDQAGVYRNAPVIITGSRYPTPAPDKIEPLMDNFVDWLNQNESTWHPIEWAARAHKEFVFIHPFIDGNGRVARLLMNLCLLRHGYTIAIIPPLLRAEYIALLEKAHEDDNLFIRFIIECIEETQKDLLRMLKGS